MTAIANLQDENRELRQEIQRLNLKVHRLQLSFAFHCRTGALSIAQVATALNMSQVEVAELMRKLPSSPVSHSQTSGDEK